MSLGDAAVSAFLQAVVLSGVPSGVRARRRRRHHNFLATAGATHPSGFSPAPVRWTGVWATSDNPGVPQWSLQTGFAEELLFRGLIAGSLSRRLTHGWANLTQAFIFFLPHLAILYFAPELWVILPFVFVGALAFGWVRIKSGSILGSWLMHASGNVAMGLMVAIRTSA
jgi:membrane protease YdiL (CAAX protease family)